MKQKNISFVRLLIMLWVLSVLTATAWAENCQSTNILVEGEELALDSGNTSQSAISQSVIHVKDLFIVGGVQMKYLGADALTDEIPKVALKNMVTGEIITSVVDRNRGIRATFTLELDGLHYTFENASTTNVDDYDLQSITGLIIFPQKIMLTSVSYESNLRLPAVKFKYQRGTTSSETTPKLFERESYNLADGTRLTVEQILFQDYAGGVHQAWFCLNGVAQSTTSGGNTPDTIINTTIEPVTLPVTLENYPALFVRNGNLNAHFVVGERAAPTDNLAMTDIASGLVTSGNTVPAGSTELDNEINDPLYTNLIVISTGNANEIAGTLLGGDDCENVVQEGQALLALYEHNGYAQLLVLGHSGSDTRKAAAVLKDYQRYTLRGQAMLISGTAGALRVEPTTLPSSCSSAESENSGRADREESSSTNEDSTETRAGVTPSAETTTRSTPTIEIPATPHCDGCRENGNCLPYGTRLVQDNGIAVYCNIDSKLQKQQEFNLACQNNYECLSNQCSNGKCIDLNAKLDETQSFLQRILDWLERVFR